MPPGQAMMLRVVQLKILVEEAKATVMKIISA